jgi:hypothetical protein
VGAHDRRSGVDRNDETGERARIPVREQFVEFFDRDGEVVGQGLDCLVSAAGGAGEDAVDR